MKYVGYIVTFVFIVFVNSVISGWAFSVLWGWFIVSAFGLPALSIPMAIGVMMTISFAMPTKEESEDGKGFSDRMIGAFSVVVAKSLVLVGGGWVVLHFV